MATRYLNLEGFEVFESEKKKGDQYKANAYSWKLFKNDPPSLGVLTEITEKILSSDISLEESLRMFEEAVIKGNPKNKSYTHYLRPIHMAHNAEASKPDYKSKHAILVPLQCGKECIIGFGHKNYDFRTATGDFLETVFYPFLKGIYHFSNQ